MYKITDFRKCCPECQALSKSLTKNHCDFCNGHLVIIDGSKNMSQHNVFDNTFTFKIWGKTKISMREIFDD